MLLVRIASDASKDMHCQVSLSVMTLMITGYTETKAACCARGLLPSLRVQEDASLQY